MFGKVYNGNGINKSLKDKIKTFYKKACSRDPNL